MRRSEVSAAAESRGDAVTPDLERALRDYRAGVFVGELALAGDVRERWRMLAMVTHAAEQVASILACFGDAEKVLN